ncbi:MAG: carbohydrate kinase [Puniceicoccales bacterium]|jgi:xylulokinase|nr:carbohydrate kinase [Puniceicoccales bacterium]
MPSHFLGFDSSTQGLKALVIDADAGAIVAAASVNFGGDLPQYASPEGVLANDDPTVKHANPLLWLEALDLVLRRLVEAGAPLGDVRGIGGSGQQHGSVYLNDDRAFGVFASLDPARSLAEQFAGVFSRPTSPIWMDSSTSVECRELAAAIGARLQADTGSPAIERFTGPQIRRFYKTDPEAYAATVRIHLVSSFLASVLIGGDAPVDRGDGAGMNLLNLRTGTWDAVIADATAPNLIAKLPRVGATGSLAGALSPYFQKYGLPALIPVALWTGDNPASLIGMGAHRPGKAVVSLGTSDTVFAAFDEFHTDPDGYGHVFGNPAGGNMSLACFKNGSLARDRVRAEAGVSWEFFDTTAFDETVPGNDGSLALPWFEHEITPSGRPVGLRANFDFAAAPPAVRIRAAVEGQVISRAVHSEWVGHFDTLRVTGGASRSRGILQTLADVFQARVETIAVTDSAALGAALIAAHDIGGHSFDALAERFCPTVEIVRPRPEHAATYQRLHDAVRLLENA